MKHQGRDQCCPPPSPQALDAHLHNLRISVFNTKIEGSLLFFYVENLIRPETDSDRTTSVAADFYSSFLFALESAE